MSEMGRYCKAYYVRDLRRFAGWKENLANLRPDRERVAKDWVATDRLEDDDYLFLQENHVVTDSHLKDENVIFDEVTDEWIAFCKEELRFEIPADVLAASSDQSSG